MTQSAIRLKPSVLDEARDFCQWLERDSTDQVRGPWLFWIGAHPHHQVAYQRTAWPSDAQSGRVQSVKASDSSKKGERDSIEEADLYEIATGKECATHLYADRWHILIGPQSSLKLHPTMGHLSLRRGSALLASQGSRGTRLRISLCGLDLLTSSGQLLIDYGTNDVPERVLLLSGSLALQCYQNFSSHCKIRSGQIAEIVRPSSGEINSRDALRVADLAVEGQRALLDSSVGPGWDRWVGECQS
jgi:hypothetical protein